MSARSIRLERISFRGLLSNVFFFPPLAFCQTQHLYIFRCILGITHCVIPMDSERGNDAATRRFDSIIHVEFRALSRAHCLLCSSQSNTSPPSHSIYLFILFETFLSSLEYYGRGRECERVPRWLLFSTLPVGLQTPGRREGLLNWGILSIFSPVISVLPKVDPAVTNKKEYRVGIEYCVHTIFILYFFIAWSNINSETVVFFSSVPQKILSNGTRTFTHETRDDDFKREPKEK